MTQVRRFMVALVLAVSASACLAIPASGAVTFRSGDASWSITMEGFPPGPGFYPLSIGANGDSVDLTTLSGDVDGFSHMSASWGADIGQDTLDYTFSANEFTDHFSLMVNDLTMYMLIHTDLKPVVFGSQSGFISDCIPCQNSFSWNASSDADPDGGYLTSIFVTSHAETTDGANLFSGQLRLAVAEAPEPATWAMMLAGFGGLGAALRSKRKRLVAI